MKKLLLRIPLLLAAMFLTSIPLSAFEVDGIHYNITNATNKTVEVTHSGDYTSSIEDRYTGDISIPNSVTYSGTSYSVTSIGGGAFYYCTGLTSVTIPNSVTSIGNAAFSDCTGLTSITIPNLVTSIGDNAFRNCIGLTSITIPNFVTYIGNGAFYGCGLTDLIISDAYNSILNFGSNQDSFNGCPIKTLYIGRKLYYAVRNVGIGATGVTYQPSTELFSNHETVISLTIGKYATGIAGCNSSKMKQLYILDGEEELIAVFTNSPLEEVYLGRNPSSGSFQNIGTLTSLTIGDSVTTIPGKTFKGCFGLTSVTIPNNVEYIGAHAFEVDTIYFNAKKCSGENFSFSEIKSLKIGDSVKCISEYIFSNALSMDTITIPNTVTQIESHAFANNGIRAIKIPASITEINPEAFYNCYNLVGPNFRTSHTTFTLSSLTTPTEYTPYCYNHYNKKYMNVGDKITGLAPSTSLSVDCGLIINGIHCRTYTSSPSTYSFSVNLRGNATVTTLSATGSHSNGDVTILGEGINLGQEVTNFDNNSDSIFENLDPNTTYTVYYGVKIKESSSAYTTSKTFTTGALEWSAGEYQATSTTSVRLMTETTCDATAGTGIEWRRYGAPESLAPNKAECPVVDGMLVGYLKGLNHEAYYEYRPYYTSASGKTYYGEWTAFFSGDAGVYFEPEVRTFTENSVDGNSVTIKGYALPGTDEVTGQGFEYWKASGISTYSTDNVKTVSASGISMSVTLSNLDYNSTYCYRAFVTTAKGTTYGDTVEFSTGYPAGIYTVEADKDENTASYRIMPGMLVVNGEGETPVMVADMNGRVLFNGYAAGQLELPLKAGIYILRLGNNAHKVAIR